MSAAPEAETDPLVRGTKSRSPLLDRVLMRTTEGFDPDWIGRARLLLGVTAVCLAASIIGAVRTTIWGPRENTPIVLGIVLGSLLVPVLLRHTGSLFVGANALNVVIYAGLLGLILNTAGQTIPPYMLLPSLPLLASLISGGRSGLFWGGMAFGALGIAYVVSPDIGAPAGSSPLLAPDLIAQGKFFGCAQMLAIVTATSMTEWKLRRDSLAALGEAKRLSDERYQQLVEQQSHLEEARSDEAGLRDRFFSHISHELRTPLTPLHQFLTLLLDEVPGPITPEQREYLEIALRNADHMKKLIEDLTDAARLQSGQMETEMAVVELEPIARQAARTFANEASKKEVTFAFCVSGQAARRAYSDPRRTHRILKSLLENAVRFAPEDSKVEIRIEDDPEDENMVRLSVSDEGPGIDPEARERIFQSLAQEEVDEWESRQGLGLGLFIARALVKRLGGRLWVESEKGTGATFLFTLPAYDLTVLVRSILEDCRALLDEVGLLVLQIHGDDPETTALVHRAVGEELGVILYPHADVVLPVAAPGVPRNCHVALTRTNDETLPRLVERMAAHFRDFAPLRERGASITFESHVVRFEHEADMDASIRRATGRIEEVVSGLAGGDRNEASSRLGSV